MISHSSIKSSISFINLPASQISQKMRYIKRLIKMGISPVLGILTIIQICWLEDAGLRRGKFNSGCRQQACAETR